MVTQLKVFGCITYAYVSTPNKDKFDKKCEQIIFIGYSNESKGYHLFNPEINKLVLWRDFIFQHENGKLLKLRLLKNLVAML